MEFVGHDNDAARTPVASMYTDFSYFYPRHEWCESVVYRSSERNLTALSGRPSPSYGSGSVITPVRSYDCSKSRPSRYARRRHPGCCSQMRMTHGPAFAVTVAMAVGSSLEPAGALWHVQELRLKGD